MTPNTYHEEIPDQDVVEQLEQSYRDAVKGWRARTRRELQEDWDANFLLTLETGVVVMPRPTGKWARDDRGFWREIYTDRIVLNADGSERSREPYTSACGIMAEEGAFDENGPTVRRRDPKVERRSWRNLWGFIS